MVFIIIMVTITIIIVIIVIIIITSVSVNLILILTVIQWYSFCQVPFQWDTTSRVYFKCFGQRIIKEYMDNYRTSVT